MSGDPPERQDDARLHERDLSMQVGQTFSHFFGLDRAVLDRLIVKRAGIQRIPRLDTVELPFRDARNDPPGKPVAFAMFLGPGL